MRSRSRNGLTVIEILVVIGILGLLAGLILAGVQKARAASARASCQNRLRQLGLALHQYHGDYGAFPSGVRHTVLLPGVGGKPNTDPEPFPLMTWHTRLLPYIEQDVLWRVTVQAYSQDRYILADPPHTARSVEIALFLCPADSPRPQSPASAYSPPGLTSFLGVEGITFQRQSGLLYLDSALRFADVLDGTSSTLLVGERPPGRYGHRGRWYGGWGTWGNADSYLGVREDYRRDDLCSPGPYPFQPGRIEDDCSTYHFWSLHVGGANFLFVDGGVRYLPYSAADLLPALASRAGSETQAIP